MYFGSKQQYSITLNLWTRSSSALTWLLCNFHIFSGKLSQLTRLKPLTGGFWPHTCYTVNLTIKVHFINNYYIIIRLIRYVLTEICLNLCCVIWWSFCLVPWLTLCFHSIKNYIDWMTYINPPGENSSRWGELKAPEDEPFVLVEPLFFSSEIQCESHQSETFFETESKK